MNLPLSQFLLAPRFSSDRDNRLAPILNTVLWAGLALTLLFMAATFVLPPSPYLSLPIELGIVVLHAICLILLHRRFPRWSATVYGLGLWLLVSYGTLTTSQITSTGVSSLYTVILLGGLLLGPAGGFGLAALSAIGILVSIYLMHGANPAFEDWVPAVTVILNFGLVAVAAWLGERSITRSMAHASSSQSLSDQRSAQLQAAAEIGNATAISSDLKTLLTTITQVISERFGFYHVSILTSEPGDDTLTFIPISEGGKRSGTPSPEKLQETQGKSIIIHVAKTKKPYIARDVKTDSLYLHNPRFPDTRSELAVPILTGDQLFGVMDVLSDREVPLGKDELNALQLLANQIGAAVQATRLQDSMARHLEELEALHAIASAGTETTGEDEFLRKATEVVGKSLFPTNFGVLLVDEKQRVLKHHASYSEKRGLTPPTIPLGEGITGLVALSGQPMRVDDVSLEPKYISIDPRVRSELCVPLRSGERVLGVLDVESYERNSFTIADQHLLQALAGQIVVSLERIRLLVEAQQRADELANTLQQQEELSRLRDGFIQNVSQEFRTPLAIVSGYIEILESGELGSLPEAYRHPVDIVAKRFRLLTTLVENLTSLLDIAAHRGDFTELRLSDIVNPMYADFRLRALTEQVELDLDADHTTPLIRGEESLLRKAIDNLVDNAIKFTPPEGKVHIGVKPANGYAVVEVSDTGIGIPIEEQPHIFERFYQGDKTRSPRAGGTGLGLALVKEIVELHGGEISVESKVGQGSTFRIKLPAIKK